MPLGKQEHTRNGINSSISYARSETDCVPQNSYVETKFPVGWALEAGPLGGGLDHESKATMNGMSTLIKETPESSQQVRL